MTNRITGVSLAATLALASLGAAAPGPVTAQSASDVPPSLDEVIVEARPEM